MTWYLRITLPSGAIWTQTSVAYGSFEAVNGVWGHMATLLPPGSTGMAITRDIYLKEVAQ